MERTWERGSKETGRANGCLVLVTHKTMILYLTNLDLGFKQRFICWSIGSETMIINKIVTIGTYTHKRPLYPIWKVLDKSYRGSFEGSLVKRLGTNLVFRWSLHLDKSLCPSAGLFATFEMITLLFYAESDQSKIAHGCIIGLQGLTVNTRRKWHLFKVWSENSGC